MNHDVLEYSKLKNCWGSMMVKMGLARDSGSEIFEDLISRHSTGNRFFHNSTTLLRMLDEYVAAHGQDVAVEFSIWFLNYSIDMNLEIRTNKIIEAVRNAHKALGVSVPFRNKVSKLLLSEVKQSTQKSLEEKILSDIQLAYLGMNLTEFAASCASIRSEHPQMSNYLFSQFQLNNVKRHLAKDKIYFTQYFIEKYEARARMNLKGLIPS